MIIWPLKYYYIKLVITLRGFHIIFEFAHALSESIEQAIDFNQSKANLGIMHFTALRLG